VIITVQNVWREGDDVVATVLEGASVEETRFRGEEAQAVALAWIHSQRDRERYAAMPADFPTPVGIPVELPNP
jgi:hypothetical protein